MKPKAGRRLRELELSARRKRRNEIGWWYVPGVLGYAAISSALILGASWFFPAEIVWLYAGFMGGASLLLLHVAVWSPEVERYDSGAMGEEFVADKLNPLRRTGWHVFHNVEFDRHDVDHVVIGPGGIVVLETKWSDSGWGPDASRSRQEWIRKAERQIKGYPTKIERVLKQNGCELTVAGCAIVACGAGRPKSRTRTEGGVRVIPVGDLREFLRDLPERLLPDEVEAAREALQRFVDERTKHDRRVAGRRPVRQLLLNR